MFPRSIPIPQDIEESFFLWGPRQAGKTTFLLDEGQRLMVEHGLVSGRCGSSARKLRRGHADRLWRGDILGGGVPAPQEA